MLQITDEQTQLDGGRDDETRRDDEELVGELDGNI